jgi:hypothetical protein
MEQAAHVVEVLVVAEDVAGHGDKNWEQGS